MNLRRQFANSVENQSNYPSLENLVPQKNYAITINPIPVTDELKVLTTYQDLIAKLGLFCGNLKLYTEVSKKNQNVHYHGFINWKSYLTISTFYMNIKQIKEYCQFEIDTINELWVWYSYITKQVPYMHRLCAIYKIPNIIKYPEKKVINKRIK